MPTRTRIVAAFIAAAAFGIPLFISLATTVPPIAWAPINHEPLLEGGFPAALHGRWSIDPDGLFFTRRIGLRTSDPARLLAHEEIGLQFVDDGSRPDLVDAELAFVGTTCSYRTRPRAAFLYRPALMLSRGAGCGSGNERPTGDLRLILRLRAPATA